MTTNIPSKLSKKRRSLPWLNKDLKEMAKLRSRLYKNAKQTQHECKIAFKKAEINHINNTIQKGLEENNSKPFWWYVISRRQDSVGVAPPQEDRRVNNG
jgi:hypothetical protein